MALRYLGVFPKGGVPMKLADVSKGVEKDLAVGAYQVIGEAKKAEKPASATMTVTSPLKNGEAKVPDFSGFPTREAVKAALALGLVPEVEGTGRLSRQEPAAGAVIAKGSTIKLVFEPPS
jgi:cell division protein FtsI (penicillin-binding protein 3)